MVPDPSECDRCGATIVYDEFDEPYRFGIPLEDDKSEPEAVYDYEERELCYACRRELLVWIDEGEVDRSDRVDLPQSVTAAQSIEYTANTLDQLAEVLRTELDDV